MEQKTGAKQGEWVRRHRLITRIWHGVNAGCLAILLMSGLMIFNAHPRLYWGEFGANDDAAWAEIGAVNDAAGALRGGLRVGEWYFDTTGVLGASRGGDGAWTAIAFPGWATIPATYDLAKARAWHLAFALALSFGLAGFLAISLINGHVRRDLHMTRSEWRVRHIWDDVVAHVHLRFPKGPAAARYGVLQKLAYCGVLFGLLPLMIFTGMAMAPGMDAGWPWLTEVFGGRQSARSVHFLAMLGLVGFFGVHMAMVLLSGAGNQMRAMVTGWYRLPPEAQEEEA